MSLVSNYWGGARSDSNVIRPLEVDCFKTFVERFINIPVVLPMTKADFFSRTKKERDAIKNGPYFCACSFNAPVRNDSNAKELELLCFDIDDAPELLRIYQTSEAISEQLWPYNFVVYETANSTPEAPRLRLVIPLVPCDLEHHRRLVYFILERIGLPRNFRGVTESTTRSQPMYRPVSFEGDTDSPVLCSRTDGLQLDIKDVPEMEEAKGVEARTYAYEGDVSDAFGLAYLPILDLKVEDIIEPLNAIDPDIERPIWAKICACLRHQFREEDEARAAFDVFLNWSERGSKFCEGEPYRIWKSFRPDTTGKAPATIRVLFWWASKAGWKETVLAQDMQKALEQWIDNCVKSGDLLEEGCKRINALPFKNAMTEDFLMAKIQQKFKSIEKVTIEKSAIKRELANVKHQKRVEEVGSEKPDWLRPIIYVGKINKFHNVVTNNQLDPESFDNMYSVKLIGTDPDSESAKSGRPAILPRHYALNQIKVERVHDTIYCPLLGSEAQPIVEYKGQLYLNTYLPRTTPTPDPDNSQFAGKLFMDHMAILIPEPEYRAHLVDFLCHNVQFPGVKIPWCPVIQSAEGVGKGILGRMMKGVLGEPNVTTIGPQTLQSQWTDWYVGHVFGIFEEVHIPGQHREAVMNGVKVAISDPSVPINKRNTTAYEAPNYTNWIAFTNFLDALHLKPTDRRWMANQSDIQTDEQVQELVDAGHFTRMEPIMGKLSGALRHWMLNHDISKSFPRHGPAPKTRHRQAIIENSKNPMLVEIEKLIKDPDEPMIGDDVILWEQLETMTRHLSKSSSKASLYLRSLGFERWNHGQVYIVGGMRSEIYIHTKRYLPDLGDPEEILALRAIEDEI